MVHEAEVRQLRRDAGPLAVRGPGGQAAAEGRPGRGVRRHQVQGGHGNEPSRSFLAQCLAY